MAAVFDGFVFDVDGGDVAELFEEVYFYTCAATNAEDFGIVWNVVAELVPEKFFNNGTAGFLPPMVFFHFIEEGVNVSL